MNKQALGRSGEDYCVERLKEQGYEILHHNYHCRYGEIDIIARDGHFLVFVEVKTRTNESIDHAMQSITYSKQKKITKAAMYFVYKCSGDAEVSPHRQNSDDRASLLQDIREYRFDVIILQKNAICEKDDTPMYHFHHIKNAFPPAEVGEFFA